ANIPSCLTIELTEIIEDDPRLEYPNLNEHILNQIENQFRVLFSEHDKKLLSRICAIAIHTMKNNAKKKARKHKITLKTFTKTTFQLQTTNLLSVISASSSSCVSTIVRIPPCRVKLLTHYNYQSPKASINQDCPPTAIFSPLPDSQSITFRSNESSPTAVQMRNTNSNKEENDRIITYWKLKNNISDHAVNELHKIHTSIPSIWSIRNVRKRLNNNIHVNNTEFGSYIAMKDAIKTLIHTNGSTKTEIRRNITIPLSIDGTQIGEKTKVLVLCISCTQFNSKQQMASKLLPIGLFKIDIEDYETVKKVIPNEIISSLIQDQKLIINGEQFSIKFKFEPSSPQYHQPIVVPRWRFDQPDVRLN
ncbi:unnamed protein product, partial [Didymodactylos carnosus]